MIRRLLLLLSTCVACRDLPDIPRDVCGNRVLERNEDCDTFNLGHLNARCRAPDEPNACHFDCSLDADGGSASCPDGWACDPDAVCREISADFEPPVSLNVSGAWSVSAADFDGDGRTDLLGQTPLDLFGRAPLQWFYFDALGQVSAARSFPKRVAPPIIAQLTHDPRADLVFNAHPGATHLQANSFRVGVLRGSEDREWIPQAFSSYRIPSAHMRMVGVYDGLIGRESSASALAVITSLGPNAGVYVPFEDSGMLDRVAPLEGPVEQLIDSPRTGDLFDAADSPCRELVLALKGAQTFSVVDLCERGERDTILFRRPSRLTQVALEPPATLDAAPSIADLDGDGHLDVILGAGGRAYVAYGDGHALAPAVPFNLPSAYPQDNPALPSPLAVGDVTADGFPDFVFSTHLLLSHAVPSSELPAYERTYTNPGAPWSVARIADLNANRHPDIIAASAAAAGIDVYSGTGSRYLVPGPIETQGAVPHLEVGDFDGDLINDLAFVQTHLDEEAVEAADTHELRIAYGKADKFPDPPLTTAQVSGTEQLAIYQEGGLSHLMLSSWDAAGKSGSLTLMYGTPDRIPFAPHTLVSFAEDGDVGGSSALAVLPGRFVASETDTDEDGDVLAIGSREGSAFSFWLVPDITTGQTTPRRLEQPFPEGFTAAIQGAGGSLRPNVARQAADLDQDGVDEALFLLPSADLLDCGLFVYAMQAESRLVLRASLALDRPCIDAQLATADLDEDGALDITLLTGGLDATDREIRTLWNNGSGDFSWTDQALVADGPSAIRALAIVPKTAARSATLVVARDNGAQLLEVDAKQRTFGPPTSLTNLSACSGVAAGDFNGDGAPDVALVAAGDIRVFFARLVVP